MNSLDAANPLAGFRARFHLPPGAPIYLDGNSLGLLCADAEKSVRRALAEWKTLAIGGWLDASPPWFTLAETLAARVARLIGAEPSEVTVANSTTVNLHQLLATLFKPRPPRNKIVACAGEFPSDLYAIQSHLRLRGLDPATHLILVPSSPDRLVDLDALYCALDDPSVGLAVLPSVVYTTGELLDLRTLTGHAHTRGVCLGFDLSHSIGVVPHRLSQDGADFAFWCHYKYLNAGPGAVGGLYLNARHFHRPPGLAGWWGANKSTMFDLAGELDPAGHAGGLQIGTPPILGLAALEGALAVVEEAGLAAIREESLRLTDRLMELVATHDLAAHGIGIANPREGNRRGGHVALTHPEAGRICRALKDTGVIVDFRPPNIIRLAPAPLYNSDADCETAIKCLAGILATQKYQQYPLTRALVP